MIRRSTLLVAATLALALPGLALAQKGPEAGRPLRHRQVAGHCGKGAHFGISN